VKSAGILKHSGALGISQAFAVAAVLIVLAACGGNQIPSTSTGASTAIGERTAIAAHDLIEDGRALADTHAFPPHQVIGSVPPGANKALDVLYHDGFVTTFPAIGVVYWGFGANGDPDHEIPLINSFLGRIRGSAPLRVVTQYYEVYKGRKIHIPDYPAMSFATWKDDVDPLPKPFPRDSDVRLEAQRAARYFKFHLAHIDNLMIVAIPHGIPMRYAACAYHGKTAGITYTNLPYQPDFGVGCGAYSVHHGRQGELDGVTETIIHEVAESMSDPRFAGWYDAKGYEIGDKCQQYADKASFDGREFAVQPLWSNASGSCRY
jgi:hypothetical protein